MSDQDRGAYTPPSERLAFDPREPVRSGPPPVTLIVSGLVLLGLIGGVVFVYRHGARHPGAAPAEVGQPIGAMKTPAPVDANAIAAAQSPPPANGPPTFAAEPEQPLPRPGSAPPLVVAPPAGQAPQAVAAGAPPPPPPAALASAGSPKMVGRPPTIASLADSAVSGPPPKPRASLIAAKPAPAAAAAGPATGWVQIGAFSSPALAARGWSDVAKLAPAAMAGKGKVVQPVTTGGAVLYRTYITGFAGRPEAVAFCDKLRAAGKSCFVK
ncbi:MAG TPA: SPOR domain-containing protein [Caulobacteraceae bacterium]|nr:SPOR domain-containing protein [Caulobacteraceae bacterium]